MSDHDIDSHFFFVPLFFEPSNFVDPLIECLLFFFFFFRFILRRTLLIFELLYLIDSSINKKVFSNTLNEITCRLAKVTSSLFVAGPT